MPSALDVEIDRLGPLGGTRTLVEPRRRSVYAQPLQSASLSLDPRERIMGLGAQAAIKAGLGVEGARAVQAVLQTESAFTPGRVGDLGGGGSYGPLQFFAQGQLPQFASSLGVSVEQAKSIAETHPEVALEYAVRGYLGAAIRKGMTNGLTGARLASFAQRFGQVSENPEKAGVNYEALFGDGQLPIGLGRADTTAYKGGTRGQDPGLVPNQFGDPTLTAEEAVSACGPAAAVAFARKWGRNPTLRETLDLAKTTGWTQGGGMNGLANQVALVQKLAKAQGIEIPVKAEYGAPNWDAVIHDAMQGNPVTISTDRHYYVVDGYDPQTQKFHVGQSGIARKDINSAWASAADITRADGVPNGVMYIDHPLVPGQSYAGRTDEGNRDDWRLSSRPQANTGYGSDWQQADQDDQASAYDDPYTERGHERGLGPDARATYGGLPSFDPLQTAGWRAAREVDADFTYGLPARQQAQLAEVNASSATPAVQPMAARRPTTPAYESVFESALDPSRGVPYLDVTAPSARRFY